MAGIGKVRTPVVQRDVRQLHVSMPCRVLLWEPSLKLELSAPDLLGGGHQSGRRTVARRQRGWSGAPAGTAATVTIDAIAGACDTTSCSISTSWVQLRQQQGQEHQVLGSAGRASCRQASCSPEAPESGTDMHTPGRCRRGEGLAAG